MGFTSPYVPMIYFEKNDGWLEDIQDTDQSYNANNITLLFCNFDTKEVTILSELIIPRVRNNQDLRYSDIALCRSSDRFELKDK